MRTTSILLAELTGVEHALGQVRDLRSPVTIVTDCMPAVNALRTLTATGTQTISASCASHQQITQTVRRLCAALRYHPNVQVCWTRGHAGHPLNEAADRIARHTRIADGVTTTQVTALRDGIAADAAQAFAARHVA